MEFDILQWWLQALHATVMKQMEITEMLENIRESQLHVSPSSPWLGSGEQECHELTPHKFVLFYAEKKIVLLEKKQQ